MPMNTAKNGIASNGQLLHYSVGAVIERDGKYLLVDRVKPPLGFAGVAGHVDEGEDFDAALIREVEEESALKVISAEPLFEEEILWNYCSTAHAHMWKLYACTIEGEVRQNTAETKSIGWYTKEELEMMNLEPVWRHWFEKLHIIKRKKKITLCGSMKFFDEMNQIKADLEARGFVVDSPDRFLQKQDDPLIFEKLDDPIWGIKHDAILAHFRKVLWSDAIVVVNHAKNGIEGYIGGNTLMEIAFATWNTKEIYFLNAIPKDVSYREELCGMQPVVINGNLDLIL